jgi:hypothetical protein
MYTRTAYVYVTRVGLQPIMIKELLQTATAGAALAVATTAAGGLLVGGYAHGDTLQFDYLAPAMQAAVPTAFLGLLYMTTYTDDDCTRSEPACL